MKFFFKISMNCMFDVLYETWCPRLVLVCLLRVSNQWERAVPSINHKTRTNKLNINSYSYFIAMFCCCYSDWNRNEINVWISRYSAFESVTGESTVRTDERQKTLVTVSIRFMTFRWNLLTVIDYIETTRVNVNVPLLNQPCQIGRSKYLLTISNAKLMLFPIIYIQ